MRFIPARAGNRALRPAASRRQTVYPRSRGEQFFPQLASSSQPGLSPLARGTVMAKALHDPEARFIPARAGNRLTACCLYCVSPVYPRSRGEQSVSNQQLSDEYGLSPLARGTDVTWCYGHMLVRFIPARAGNRNRRYGTARTTPVYPRSRGEQSTWAMMFCSTVGLSPLARGTVFFRIPGTQSKRFIPARAGNSAWR
ncbi:hypothetical protein CTU_10250 [Cronobacter turicensis z3032]|nr:hypothetical protein CTU_10250 [Cronobacter turicensis z3032]